MRIMRSAEELDNWIGSHPNRRVSITHWQTSRSWLVRLIEDGAVVASAEDRTINSAWTVALERAEQLESEQDGE